MRRTNIFRLLFAVALALPTMTGAAYATNVTISGTHSKTEIKSTCAANGGGFSDDGANGYSCIGKGGIVTCSNAGKCTGSTFAPFGSSSAPIGTILTPAAKNIGH